MHPPANGGEGPLALQDLPRSASAPPKLPAVPEVQPEVGPKEIPSLPVPQATVENQQPAPQATGKQQAGAQDAVLENDAVANHEKPITLRESMEKLKQARLTAKGAGTARDRNTKGPLKRPASAMEPVVKPTKVATPKSKGPVSMKRPASASSVRSKEICQKPSKKELKKALLAKIPG